MLPVFLRSFVNALMFYLPQWFSGVKENGKWFVEQRVKEIIIGGSQMDFIDELL